MNVRVPIVALSGVTLLLTLAMICFRASRFYWGGRSLYIMNEEYNKWLL